MLFEGVGSDDKIVHIDRHEWHVCKNGGEDALYVTREVFDAEWCTGKDIVLTLPSDVEFVLVVRVYWELIESGDHVEFREKLFLLKGRVQCLDVGNRSLVVDDAHVDAASIDTDTHLLDFAAREVSDYWKEWHVVSWPFAVFPAVPVYEFPVLQP